MNASWSQSDRNAAYVALVILSDGNGRTDEEIANDPVNRWYRLTPDRLRHGRLLLCEKGIVATAEKRTTPRGRAARVWKTVNPKDRILN